MTPGWFRRDGDDLVLFIRVQPRARTDTFGEVQDGRMVVRITAPPVDGKANKHLTQWLARTFGVNRSSVLIESGETGRHKRIRIRNPGKLPTAITDEPGAG